MKTAGVFMVLLFTSGGVFSVLADGLPGEYIVTQRWRDLLAPHSPATNPAFMTEENYVSLRGGFAFLLNNTFKLWEGGIVVPIGLYQSAGFTWIGENAGEVQPTQWNPTTKEIEIIDGPKVSNQNSFFMLSYAINPWRRLSIAANLNIAHQTNFGSGKARPGVDFGLSYRLIRHPVLGDHVVGVALQNLIPIDLGSGEQIAEGKTSTNVYARNLKLSLLSHIWEKRIELGVDADIKDIMAQQKEFVDAVTGGDGTPEVEFDLNARLGVWILRVLSAYVHAGNDFLGFSGGMNVPTINNGRDFQVMYQYMFMFEGDEASSHTVYLRADVGKHREEIYARKMARLASVSPNLLYNKALTLFHSGKYWEAFFVFGRIYSEFPDFFKNDYVSYYLGRCQELLDMRKAATESYEEAKKAYPKSVVVPMADLGLMRVAYRSGDGAAVANQFAKLNTPGVPDTLKYHAFYLMGEQHLRESAPQKAMQLFSMVPETHPEYIFAQHSAAVAHARSDNVPMAIENLENSVQAVATTEAQKEMINRSYLFLGYIFYEGLGGQERALSKAVTALRRIPKGSYYYEDALLGLAWTALNAQQWADCINAAKDLQNVSDKVVLQSEAALLEAYGYMMQKNYSEAVKTLESAYNNISKLTPPSEDELQREKQEYGVVRDNYHNVAAKAKELALTQQSSIVVNKIDSIAVHQKDLEEDIHEFLRFNDEFARRSFFARNIQTVSDDIEYALAKAQKLAGTRDVQKVKEKVSEEQEELDEEMQKLQEQLQELEEEQ